MGGRVFDTVVGYGATVGVSGGELLLQKLIDGGGKSD